MSTNSPRPGLTSPKSAKELLDLYFLDARSQLLETAAIFDRIERAKGGSEIINDSRMIKLRESCDILKNSRGNRVQEFLLLFSDPQ